MQLSLLLVIALSYPVRASTIALPGKFTGPVDPALKITVDHCTFKGDGGGSIVEIYLDLSRSAFTHRQTPDGWYGALNCLVVIDDGLQIVGSDRWSVEDIIAAPESGFATQRIIDGRVYALAPRTYTFSIYVADSLGARYNQTSLRIEVPAFSDTTFAISDLELGGYLLGPGEHPRFDRGDFTFIPNPRRLFGQQPPFLYYYLELYPASQSTGPGDYRIRRWVSDAAGETVRTFPVGQLTGGPEPFADLDSLPLGGLGSGSYRLHLVVEGPGGPASRDRKFFLHDDALPPRTVATGATYFDSASVEEELGEITFLLGRNQLDALAGRSARERGSFLEAFWRRYDDDPRTPEVPARLQFRYRVAEADQRWDNTRSPGHKTDRGRIYVLFGEPAEREQHPLDAHAKPYEVWNYHTVDGGAVCVFVDRSGLGDYVLVHSTLRGEVVNPEWYRDFIQRSGMDTRR